MKRARATIVVALALALSLASCGGDDGEKATTPAPTAAPSQGAAPPGTGALPPALVQCYADKGYDVQSPADIHSAPPAVVQECFKILHQGGGSP